MDIDRGQGQQTPRVVGVQPVHRITTARASHSEDVSARMRRYAFSMGIRTLCVLGFVLSVGNWWAWLFVPGAVVLPYVAVILANAGRERAPEPVATVAHPTQLRAIGQSHDDAA